MCGCVNVGMWELGLGNWNVIELNLFVSVKKTQTQTKHNNIMNATVFQMFKYF